MNTNQQNNQITNNQQIQQLINKPFEDLTEINLAFILYECRERYTDIINFWYNKKTQELFTVWDSDISPCNDDKYGLKTFGTHIFKNDLSDNYYIDNYGFFGIDWVKKFRKSTKDNILKQIFNIYKEEFLSESEEEEESVEEVPSRLNRYFVDKYEEEESVEEEEESVEEEEKPYYEPKRPERRAVEAAIISASTATLGFLGTGLSYGALKMYRIYEKSKMKPKALYYAEVDL
jgi:hypothetical protein